VPSIRQGTLPVGEKLRKSSGPPNGTSLSSNGICNWRISTHGRSDQDE
jgi:hypothetical protein